MSENEVAIPLKAQERLRASIAQVNQMQQAINAYFQGVCDSLDLKGQWDLDAQRMVAVKRQEAAPVAEQPKGAEGTEA